MKTKVESMTSPRTGLPVANQFIIKSGAKTFFQSYDSTIACEQAGRPTKLDKTYWNYSVTTMKYLNRFLGTNGKKEILQGIESGRYKLANLN